MKRSRGKGENPFAPSASLHSPDSDDAFDVLCTGRGEDRYGDLHYVHELSDIESLNQRARRAELEVTLRLDSCLRLHWRRYALLGSGSSMGDGYGPRLRSRPRPDPPILERPSAANGSPFPACSPRPISRFASSSQKSTGS